MRRHEGSFAIIYLRYTEDKLKEICEKQNVTYIGVESRKKTTSGKQERYIQYICNIHNDKGIQENTVYNFHRYKHVCKYCNGSKLKEMFKDRVRDANANIIVKSEYTEWLNKVDCECSICGYEWKARPSVILYGGGCPKCGRKKANISEMLDRDEVVKRIQEANNTIQVIGEYNGYHNNIKCKCLVCGREWESPVCHIIYGDSSCPTCSQIRSKGEAKMVSILKSFGYNPLEQHIFYDCRYKYPLRFDAYIEEINVAFEYQGEYHYYPIDYAGKGKEWASSNTEVTQKRDNIKREYCKENNIPLIEVPYWEQDNMEYFLLHEINKIKEKANDTC